MQLSEITTPVIAQVNSGVKIYGPFANGIEASEWLKQQPEGVTITFRLLRNPNVDRTYDDFYLPDYMEDESREFDRLPSDVIIETIS